MPASDGISFTYGDYAFDPRPLFTVNKEILKTPANTGLGTRYSMTLDGTLLTPFDANNNKGGLTNIFASGDNLRDAFGRDFKNLKLQCNSDTPIINAYPKVMSIDIQNASDNYIRRMDYTINLELSSLTGNRSEPVGIDCAGTIVGDLHLSGLISLSDDFTIEFLDERIGGNEALSIFGSSVPSVFSIQRNLSVQGDSLPCEGGWTTAYEPWQRAKDYVEANLGFSSEMGSLINLMSVNGMQISNNFRNISVNKTDGTVNGTETFIAFTGKHPALEEFEISTERSNDSPFTSININGTIQGLSDVQYKPLVGSTPTGVPKFNNAVLAWTSLSGSLLSRVVSAYDALPKIKQRAGGTVNIEPLSESIGYNTQGGTITYGYNYNDRPTHCYTGALTEDISFSYNEPNDVFASLTILGRSQGPLFQAINTSGATTRDISINATIPVVNINCSDLTDFVTPPYVYNDLIAAYETALKAQYQQVFVTTDNQSWNPTVGQFSLNKSYTVGYCVTS